MGIVKPLFTTLLSIALTTGCAIQGRGSKVAFGVNGGLMVGGLAAIASSQNKDCTSPPSNTGDPLDDEYNDWGNGIGDGLCSGGQAVTTGFGVLLLVVGGIGMLANLAVNRQDDGSAEPVPGAGADLSGYASEAPADPCSEIVGQWRAETDVRVRARLLLGMSATCQQQAQKQQSGASGAPGASPPPAVDDPRPQPEDTGEPLTRTRPIP